MWSVFLREVRSIGPSENVPETHDNPQTFSAPAAQTFPRPERILVWFYIYGAAAVSDYHSAHKTAAHENTHLAEMDRSSVQSCVLLFIGAIFRKFFFSHHHLYLLCSLCCK